MFIVMEYVQGIDLYDLLEKCGRLPYDVAAIIAMQVARAMDYVHYRGIVHRDIKPANIMIARTGGVKVMDFGIARDTSFGDLTEAGTGIGTPAYMSPEQVLGDKLDARSDIFSLGVVLYQMVTGKKPFVEDEKKSAMHKIRLEKHESARAVNPEVPRELSNVIDRCLEKQPRDRWRSAQHMVMALERFLAKHVEMNHHARLVLFLKGARRDHRARGRGVLEPGGARRRRWRAATAEPAGAQHGARRHRRARGHARRAAAVPRADPRRAARRDAADTPATVGPDARGHVHVDARPWARIYVDNMLAGVTPLGQARSSSSQGKHQIRFEHDWYQPITRSLDVTAGDNELAAIDFEKTGTLKPGKAKP